MLTDDTVPAWLNKVSRSAVVASKERLPTNNFIAIKPPQEQKGPGNHEYGSRGLLSLEPTQRDVRNEPNNKILPEHSPDYKPGRRRASSQRPVSLVRALCS